MIALALEADRRPLRHRGAQHVASRQRGVCRVCGRDEQTACPYQPRWSSSISLIASSPQLRLLDQPLILMREEMVPAPATRCPSSR